MIQNFPCGYANQLIIVHYIRKYVHILAPLHTYSITFTDIDECVRGIDGCQHTCINNPGSFLCSCNTGYALASDGKDCFGKNVVNTIATYVRTVATCDIFSSTYLLITWLVYAPNLITYGHL